jgi:hypothetical protein
VATYQLWFHHSIDLDEPLSVGDAFKYQGAVWRVARVEEDSVYLELWGVGHGPFPYKIHGES